MRRKNMRPKKSIISLLTVVATALVVAGCGGSSSSNNAASSSPAATTQQVAVKTPLAKSITLLVKSDTEKAKLGSDKQWHDAFLPGDFTVQAGETVTVTVWNYDDKHSFTAPSLGVNQILAGGTEKAPAKTTFTFTAPSKPGSYAWFCALPCDPWAMAHDGYMRGFVRVTA
jgi:plastocyanin